MAASCTQRYARLPGVALRFQIPLGKSDLSQAAAMSLCAAVDPLSKINTKGKPQTFSSRVTDGAGKTAMATTRADEPALRFPIGEVVETRRLATCSPADCR